MKKKLLEKIKSPISGEKFTIKHEVIKNDEIYSGYLVCESTNENYPIINYIPRFISHQNYSDSWGELWRKTAETIRDSYTEETFYYDAIFGKYDESGKGKKGYSPFGFEWDKDLLNQNVLEIGGGVGVCLEHLMHTGANIISVDMSNAVDTLPEKILIHPKVNVIQADVLSGVMVENLYDKIWLFQVLQHTPYPSKTLKGVKPLLKKGGELSVTSYHNVFYPWYQKITKHFSFGVVYWMTKLLLPIKYYGQQVPIIGRIIRKLLEPVDPRNIYFLAKKGLSKDYVYGKLYEKTSDEKMLLWHTVINTFDTITPTYTNGATNNVIEKWLQEAEYKNIKVWGENGARGKATR